MELDEMIREAHAAEEAAGAAAPHRKAPAVEPAAETRADSKDAKADENPVAVTAAPQEAAPSSPLPHYLSQFPHASSFSP